MGTPTDDLIVARYPEAQPAIERAAAFTVATADDYQVGIDTLKKIKRLRQEWDARVRPTIRAAKKAHDEALALFKSVDGRLADVYDRVKDLCEHWVQAQREARDRHYRDLAAQASAPSQPLDIAFDEAVANGDTAKAARILDQAALPSVLHGPATATILDAPPAPSVPKVEGVAVTTPYTWEIVDESQIPREMMQPDRKKISAIVKALGRDAKIPGILVRPDTALRIRS
jgi:hypothetical protein